MFWRKKPAAVGPPGPANGYVGPPVETGAQATQKYVGGILRQGAPACKSPQSIWES